ncbi:MAG: tetratricopeptide repeat protein, partial [Bacteroidota bacterium]
MHDNSGFNDSSKNGASESARKFEEMLSQRQLYYLDLNKVDEIFTYYLTKNDFRKAQQLIELAVKIHPSSSELFFKHAKLLYENSDFSGSLKEINQALYLSPMQPEYLWFKSEVLSQLDKYEEAIELLEGLFIYTDQPSEVYLQMGNIAQICNKLPESEAYYRKALELQPEYEEALFELAFLFESEDKLLDSKELYEAYLEKNPYATMVWY